MLILWCQGVCFDDSLFVTLVLRLLTSINQTSTSLERLGDKVEK